MTLGVGRWRTLVLALCALPGLAHAQPPPPSNPPPEPPPKPQRRPGLFRVGPVYLTPRLRVGTIGVDTNVFYTATDRRADFTASGGPGLDIIVPVRSSLTVTTGGGVDYVYFLRTTSQRRLAGDGRARLDWLGTRITAGAEVGARLSFGRPNFEVDRRVEQDEQHARATLRLKVGERFGLGLTASAQRFDVEEGSTFLGADLRDRLSRDTYLGVVELFYRLSPKTWAVIQGDQQFDRFRFQTGRDADSNRLSAGLEVRSETLFSGKAVAGVRSYRPLSGSAGVDALNPYAKVVLTYHVGPRTRVGLSYDRDLYYSALATPGQSPNQLIESGRLHIVKGLIGHLDLHLYGGLSRLSSEGTITIGRGNGPPLVARRDDTVREGGADLGYVFFSHVRIGAAAGYTQRRSNIADLGIQGLLLGGTVTFVP